MAREREADLVMGEGVPCKLRAVLRAQHNGDVEDLPDVHVELATCWTEGKPSLSIPLEEDALALLAVKGERRGAALLVDLVDKTRVLDGRPQFQSEHVHLPIVELSRSSTGAANPATEWCSIGAVRKACLPVDVEESDLTIVLPVLADRGEVLVTCTADADSAQVLAELRRNLLCQDPHSLPHVFKLVAGRMLSAVDLKSGSHVSPKPCREVEAHEHWHRSPSRGHRQLFLSVFPDLGVTTLRPRKIAHLEIHLLLTFCGHHAEDVEVRESRSRVQHSQNPILQVVLGGLFSAESVVAGVLVAPPQSVPEVVGGPEWQLCQGWEVKLEIAIIPNEAVASVCESFVGPRVVCSEC
mmetsp:Transcript_164/g.364  ORF Transcript_164/g.364 Transcript_164/m.364 type:complete len:354 (+) Transcript_164:177-1238(+)